MTNTELAIQKAVEGGWLNPHWPLELEQIYEKTNEVMWWGDRTNTGRTPIATILLDPLFWQALGKNLGWGETMFPLTFSHREDGLNEETLYWKGENGHQYVPHLAGKNYYQHRLIDAIQQGRSIDEFFGEILILKSKGQK